MYLLRIQSFIFFPTLHEDKVMFRQKNWPHGLTCLPLVLVLIHLKKRTQSSLLFLCSLVLNVHFCSVFQLLEFFSFFYAQKCNKIGRATSNLAWILRLSKRKREKPSSLMITPDRFLILKLSAIKEEKTWKFRLLLCSFLVRTKLEQTREESSCMSRHSLS